jgi:hypothetical protein
MNNYKKKKMDIKKKLKKEKRLLRIKLEEFSNSRKKLK